LARGRDVCVDGHVARALLARLDDLPDDTQLVLDAGRAALREVLVGLDVDLGGRRHALGDLLPGHGRPGAGRGARRLLGCHPVVDVLAGGDLRGGELAVHVPDEIDEPLRGDVGDVRPDVDAGRDLLAGDRIVTVDHYAPGRRLLRP